MGIFNIYKPLIEKITENFAGAKIHRQKSKYLT